MSQIRLDYGVRGLGSLAVRGFSAPVSRLGACAARKLSAPAVRRLVNARDAWSDYFCLYLVRVAPATYISHHNLI